MRSLIPDVLAHFQTVGRQEVFQVIGSLFCLQQNGFIQIAGGAIPQTLDLGGLATNQLNQGLFRHQIILHHLAAGVSAISLWRKAAKLRQCTEASRRNTT